MPYSLLQRIHIEGDEWAVIMTNGSPNRTKEDLEKSLLEIESKTREQFPSTHEIFDDSEVPKKLIENLSRPGCLLYHQTPHSFIMLIPKPGKWGLALSVFDPIDGKNSRCFLGDFDSKEKGKTTIDALQDLKQESPKITFELVPYNNSTYSVGTLLKKFHSFCFPFQ